MGKDSFTKLPDERQQQILCIAAEEFARCGYEGASTNTITQRSGISKGLLFHYFGSKKQLYLRLLKGIADRFSASVERQTQEIRGSSVYENMAALFRSKAAYMAEYPLDMAFIEKSNQEQSDEIRSEIHLIYGHLGATMQCQRMEVAHRAIGASRLRDGITEEQALECVALSLDALSARFAALYKVRGLELITKPEIILDTMQMFLDVLCRGLFAD